MASKHKINKLLQILLMTIFLTTAEKLMGANQIDKVSRLKNGVPLHYILQNCELGYRNCHL